MAHGNHYHRPECENYEKWIDDKNVEHFDDTYHKDCSECVKSKEKNVCARPISIKEFYKNLGIEDFEIEEKPKKEEKV